MSLMSAFRSAPLCGTHLRRMAALLLIPAFSAACSESPTETQKPADVPLLVTTDWLAGQLTNPGVVVVQVGAEAGYRAGHIPGARFLLASSIVVERNGIPMEVPDLPALEATLEAAGISDAAHVILYTEQAVSTATRAFFTLEYIGHARVSLLDGGLEAWKAEARPISTDASATAPGSLTPRVQNERVVTAEWVLQRVQNPGVALVDARIAGEYSGQTAGTLPRPGHIPGAHNVFWRDALVS